MASDLGTDFSCATDLDWRLSLVSGREGLAQASARRLGTRAGGLFYDTDYGYDLSNMSGRALVSKQAAAARAEQELLKDERIDDANVTLDTDPDTGALVPTVMLTDGAGPFEFTLPIGDVTTQLLLGT